MGGVLVITKMVNGEKRIFCALLTTTKHIVLFAFRLLIIPFIIFVLIFLFLLAFVISSEFIWVSLLGILLPIALIVSFFSLIIVLADSDQGMDGLIPLGGLAIWIIIGLIFFLQFPQFSVEAISKGIDIWQWSKEKIFKIDPQKEFQLNVKSSIDVHVEKNRIFVYERLYITKLMASKLALYKEISDNRKADDNIQVSLFDYMAKEQSLSEAKILQNAIGIMETLGFKCIQHDKTKLLFEGEHYENLKDRFWGVHTHRIRLQKLHCDDIPLTRTENSSVTLKSPNYAVLGTIPSPLYKRLESDKIVFEIRLKNWSRVWIRIANPRFQNYLGNLILLFYCNPLLKMLYIIIFAVVTSLILKKIDFL